MAPKLHFGHDAFLIHENIYLLIGNGPSFMDVKLTGQFSPGKHQTKETIGGMHILTTEDYVVVQTADTTITYLEGAKRPDHTDVLVLKKADAAAVKKIAPKLAILMNATIYQARELHQKTGVTVIAVKHGSVVDLSDYSAIAEQKLLDKFTSKQ